MKDYKGGYVIVDGTGLDLTTLGKVSGLYNQIKDAVAINKPIVIKNVTNNGQDFTPMYCYGGVESATSVFLSFFPVTIHVDNTDTVTM